MMPVFMYAEAAADAAAAAVDDDDNACVQRTWAGFKLDLAGLEFGV